MKSFFLSLAILMMYANVSAQELSLDDTKRLVLNFSTKSNNKNSAADMVAFKVGYFQSIFVGREDTDTIGLLLVRYDDTHNNADIKRYTSRNGTLISNEEKHILNSWTLLIGVIDKDLTVKFFDVGIIVSKPNAAQKHKYFQDALQQADRSRAREYLAAFKRKNLYKERGSIIKYSVGDLKAIIAMDNLKNEDYLCFSLASYTTARANEYLIRNNLTAIPDSEKDKIHRGITLIAFGVSANPTYRTIQGKKVRVQLQFGDYDFGILAPPPKGGLGGQPFTTIFE